MFISPSTDNDRPGLDMEGRLAWYTLEFRNSADDAMLRSTLGCCGGITWRDEDLARILCISGGGSSPSVRFSR